MHWWCGYTNIQQKGRAAGQPACIQGHLEVIHVIHEAVIRRRDLLAGSFDLGKCKCKVDKELVVNIRFCGCATSPAVLHCKPAVNHHARHHLLLALAASNMSLLPLYALSCCAAGESSLEACCACLYAWRQTNNMSCHPCTCDQRVANNVYLKKSSQAVTRP
jgi:hypothetical protein